MGDGAPDSITPPDQWQDDDTDYVQNPAKKTHELEYLDNVWNNFCLYRSVRGALNKKLLLAAMIPCSMMVLNRFKEIQGNILLLPLDVDLGLWVRRMRIIAEALEDTKLSMRKDFQNFLREKTLPFESDGVIEENDSSLLDDVFEEVYRKDIKPKGKFLISLSQIFQMLGTVLNDLHQWVHDGTVIYEDIYNGIIRLCFGNSELAECSARFSSSYDTWRSKNVMNGSRVALSGKMKRELEVLQKSPIGDCALTVFDESVMKVSQTGVGAYILEHWKDLIDERRPTVMDVLRCRKIFPLLRIIVMEKRISEDIQKLNRRVPTKAVSEPKEASVSLSEESQKLFKVKEQIPVFVKLINEDICTYINTDGEKWEWDVVMYVCKSLNIIHKKPGRKQFALMIEEICPKAQKILASMSNPKEPTKNIPFERYKQYPRVESYISRYVEILKPLENIRKCG